MDTLEKLVILSDSAKYDVSCSTSGSNFINEGDGLGNRVLPGICHSWAADGRCISLLKILFSNVCIYDCAYCVNRASTDRKRASFSVQEIVDLTINFYKRNYIEGLFLSSGIVHSPDYTMGKLAEVVYKLRKEEHFNGYIHVKAIPGASPALLMKAGLYADRMSVNIELPSEKSLKFLAPDKSKQKILQPMGHMYQDIEQTLVDQRSLKHTPTFLPAGQTTQMIIGASPETDKQILTLSENIYNRFQLKRVYYSAFSPVSSDPRLPTIENPPLDREHRLYQADWLLRFYQFTVDEIFENTDDSLSTDIDPKMAWALNHRELFPVEINSADYYILLRVPGIGVLSARRIVKARKTNRLSFDDLQRMRVVLKRAQYFITANGKAYNNLNLETEKLRMLAATQSQYDHQLSLFQEVV